MIAPIGLQVRSTSVLGSGMCIASLCTGCLTASRRAFAKMRAGILWSATHQRPPDPTLPPLLAPTRRRVSHRLLHDEHDEKCHRKFVWMCFNQQSHFLTPEGSSLLGLSHISVNASMTINDTALTNGTISRLEAPDPIDSLDLTVCPADDILDGCKVRR